MARSFTLKQNFSVAPEVVYQAWLDSEKHSKMTGSTAEVSADIGGSFSTWDGYIKGTNIALVPNERIEQAWRASDFKHEHEDSKLVVELQATDGGCELTLTHSNIPDNRSDYESGWEKFYFLPMLEYFGA